MGEGLEDDEEPDERVHVDPFFFSAVLNEGLDTGESGRDGAGPRGPGVYSVPTLHHLEVDVFKEGQEDLGRVVTPSQPQEVPGRTEEHH